MRYGKAVNMQHQFLLPQKFSKMTGFLSSHLISNFVHFVVDLTNRLHFSMCVYCNRSQMTSQRAKNKKVGHEMKSSGVTVVLYTL